MSIVSISEHLKIIEKEHDKDMKKHVENFLLAQQEYINKYIVKPMQDRCRKEPFKNNDEA